MSTTVGQIVLCSTVAAASVGGVALTTDRITLDVPPSPTAGSGPPIAPTTPDLDRPQPTTMPAPPTTTTTTTTPSGPATVADEPSAHEPAPGKPGCEFGQATAEEASGGQNVRPDRDPCEQSEDPSRRAPRESTSGDDAEANANGNANGNGNGNGNGNAKGKSD